MIIIIIIIIIIIGWLNYDRIYCARYYNFVHLFICVSVALFQNG